MEIKCCGCDSIWAIIIAPDMNDIIADLIECPLCVRKRLKQKLGELK